MRLSENYRKKCSKKQTIDNLQLTTPRRKLGIQNSKEKNYDLQLTTPKTIFKVNKNGFNNVMKN